MINTASNVAEESASFDVLAMLFQEVHNIVATALGGVLHCSHRGFASSAT